MTMPTTTTDTPTPMFLLTATFDLNADDSDALAEHAAMTRPPGRSGAFAIPASNLIVVWATRPLLHSRYDRRRVAEYDRHLTELGYVVCSRVGQARKGKAWAMLVRPGERQAGRSPEQILRQVCEVIDRDPPDEDIQVSLSESEDEKAAAQAPPTVALPAEVREAMEVVFEYLTSDVFKSVRLGPGFDGHVLNCADTLLDLLKGR